MEDGKKNSLIMYIVIFLVVIIIWLIFIVVMIWSANNFEFVFPPSTSLESLGVFGDSFNILTSLFTGLAFAGVIISVILQTKELEATRKEFTGQKEALENQQKEMVQQSFDNKFFQMLRTFNDIRKKYLEKNYLYRTNVAKGTLFLSIKHKVYFLTRPKDTSYTLKTSFKKIANVNDELKHYFINLYQILKYIDKFYSSDIKNAKFYTNIVRAQLTKHELRQIRISSEYPEPQF